MQVATAVGAAAAGAVASQLWSQREAERTRAALARRIGLSPADVLVVGFGFSGVVMALRLKSAGIPFTVIEKESDVGGTWFVNRYPGCACDIPAHLYGISTEPKPDWSAPYAPAREIHEYLRGVVEKHNLRRHVRFGCSLYSARWNPATARWDVTCADGTEFHPRFLITGVGGLHVPKYPDVQGLSNFKGTWCHSAAWDAKLDSLEGKRVAVVGSAASAVQIVPIIAKQAKELYILQRTPNWISSRWSPVLPREKYSAAHKFAFTNFPLLQRLHRAAIYAQFEMLFYPVGVFDTRGPGQALATKILSAQMTSNLKNNKELIDKVVPKFGVGCKRICRTDDYLPALLQDNVHLIASGLKRVEEDGVVDSEGNKVVVDAIIYATGYEVGSIGTCRIEGLGGRCMQGTSAFDESMQAYLGCSAPEFPNSFMMLGVNTGLGHNSVVLMLESQADYVMRILTEALDNDVRAFSVKEEVVAEYYKFIDAEFERRVWKHGGCKSWYANKDGNVVALWPASTMRFFRMTAAAPGLFASYNVERDGPAHIRAKL